jgi:Tol biopolymer transport system component
MAGALIGLLASGTEASFPGRSGKIALASGLPGSHKYRIQTMTPGGKGLRTILTVPQASVFAQGEPVYSPDGAAIAFELDDDIYVVGADGAGLRPVTSGSEKDTNPTFSPDGRKIAFARITPGGYDIFSIGLDGNGLTQLTTEEGNDRDPVWSPRGNVIAFVSERTGPPSVWLMQPDGSGQRQLGAHFSSGSRSEAQPEFSPNGGRLVFSRGADLVSTRINGSRRCVLSRSGILIQPTYSPDGRRIAALEAFRNRKDFDVVVMAADGSDKRTIRSHVANAYGIGWQPIHG